MTTAYNWPTLTRERADELIAKADQAAELLADVAHIITGYPGGGGPAHDARTAAARAGDTAQAIREMVS